LQGVSSELNIIVESKSYFPENLLKEDNLKPYFNKMKNAEIKIFGNIAPQRNKNIFFLNMGDLSNLNLNTLEYALDADIYIIFGCSYIKGDLCEYLITKKAINIHMGVSPFFRGSACNFWALYDGYPEYVGATIHYLSKGLDSGPVIFHSLVDGSFCNAFEYGMYAVEAAQINLIKYIKNKKLYDLNVKKYSKEKEIRYSLKKDFNIDVVNKYLQNSLNINTINNKIKNRKLTNFHNPQVYRI
tara:strand:- start:217 stop:945 length:729 start_codon:yes stop_codon:yes gene_type:complete